MKKINFLLCCLLFVCTIEAQITIPQPSPKSTVTQRIGLTDFTITYSRPSAKSRVVYGDLVPYGEKWRTGANENTIFKFTDDITIEGQELKAGEYAIYTIPDKYNFEWIFYKNTTNWGLPEEWKETDVALRVKTTVTQLNQKIETLTFDFEDLKNTSALLKMSWENTSTTIKIGVNPDVKVMKDIDKTLAGPKAGDYYSAGKYYLDSDKDPNQAYTWLHKANELAPKYWILRQEALALAKLKRYKEAITTANKSIEMAAAEKDENYVKMNKKDIEVWSKIK
jgi:tetratricopeptide (TPR) repeat protein